MCNPALRPAPAPVSGAGPRSENISFIFFMFGAAGEGPSGRPLAVSGAGVLHTCP